MAVISLSSTPAIEEFFNRNHSKLDGRFTSGHPVTGPKAPLYNRTTGRLNPLPVRRAFKQGLSEIIGKKTDSKRTTLTGPKVRTVKTYKGRVISHVSSKGGSKSAAVASLRNSFYDRLQTKKGSRKTQVSQ